MSQLANVPGGNYAKFFDAYVPGQIIDARYSTKESFGNVDPNTISFGIGLVAGIAAAASKMVRAPRLNK